MIKIFLVFFLSFASNLLLFGQFPKPLSPPRFYNNFSELQILSTDEEAEIEDFLKKFEKETSNEITIIVVDNLNNLEPWEYATEIGENWGIGKAKEDNGIVLLIKPTKKNGRREVFIAVGRGLESVIPDLATQEIVENEIVPNFKNQEYFKGIKQATVVLSKLAKGEYNYQKYAEKNKSGKVISTIISLIVIVFFLFLFIKKGGGGTTIGAAGLISGFGRGFGRGSSGGGFGGFGGGSFGGGGSGGSW